MHIEGGTRQVGEEGEYHPQAQREWIKVQVACILLSSPTYVIFLSAYGKPLHKKSTVQTVFVRKGGGHRALEQGSKRTISFLTIFINFLNIKNVGLG